MLSKLNVRAGFPLLPYDMVRCTWDGIIHFTTEGFDDYFPAATQRPIQGDHALSKTSDPNGLRIPMDPVSIWLLFRGKHTAFTHFDLNDPRVRGVLQSRLTDWHSMVHEWTSATRPRVTFLRTILAENPVDEIRAAGNFLMAYDKISRTTDSRLVLIMHDQGAATQCLGLQCDKRCSLWNLAFDGTVAPTASLFDRCHDGYEKIITLTGQDDWTVLTPRLLDVESLKLQPRDHLSRVEGVSAFLGTCTGFGSTTTACLGGTCFKCGSMGHPLSEEDLKRFDSGREWTGDEVMEAFGPLCDPNTDAVAHIEHVASQQRRSAREVLDRTMDLFTLE